MSKKPKNKTQDKQKAGAGKVATQRVAAIESTLAKLLRISDKIIARQKNAKRRGKRQAKEHGVLKSRLDGVETQIGEQLQRIRGLSAKNSTLRERLETQAGIIKDNCARLSEFEPRLADSQQRSQQIGHQITGLIQLTEKLRERSESLDQGLTALTRRIAEPSEVAQAASDARADVPTPDTAASAADAADGSYQQSEWLEKLQARLNILDDNCTGLEQANRRLAQSIDDLSAREVALEAQNKRITEQAQALQSDRLAHLSRVENHGQQIGNLGIQLGDIGKRVEKLADGIANSRERQQQDAESQRRLAQRLDELQRDLGNGPTQEFESLRKLSDETRQQLREAGDREQALKQQVDHLGGLLVTTEGQLTEQSAQLALEDARLAQQVQLLEQRLTAFEETVGERQVEDLASLRALGDDMRLRLQEAGDRERALRQQVEGLDKLLTSTRGQLSEQTAELATQGTRLGEKAQLLEQRLDAQQQELGERLSKELLSLKGLTGILQQQLQDAGERAQSLKQQVDDLASLLQSTGGRLDEQNTKLTEQTAQLVSGQQALTVRQDRLSGGLLAAGLMILALALGGYWLVEKWLAENQSASIVQLDRIERRMLLQEQTLAQQSKQSEAADSAQESSARMDLFETRLAEHEQLFAQLEGQRDKETRSTQGALEKLRQGFAQQKQLISLRSDDVGQVLTDLQQVQAAQQEGERLLQRLAAEQAQQRTDNARLQEDLQRVKDQQKAQKAQKEREKREVQAAPAAVVEEPGDTLRGASWLRQLNPRHYIIQLVAAHNKAVIEQVAADTGRPGELAYYKGRFQGRDWYVLLYGDFPSRQRALSVSGELPESMRAFKPWVRRISTVHRELTGQQ